MPSVGLEESSAVRRLAVQHLRGHGQTQHHLGHAGL